MSKPDTFEIRDEQADIVGVLAELLARAKAGDIAVLIYATGQFDNANNDAFRVNAGVVTSVEPDARLGGAHVITALNDLARGIHQAVYS